jgi:hypothetical protein
MYFATSSSRADPSSTGQLEVALGEAMQSESKQKSTDAQTFTEPLKTARQIPSKTSENMRSPLKVARSTTC